tara:strand:+ start:1076 stop:2440 length:1365 start_codon:yes stop_codon:yes gene_type:complete
MDDNYSRILGARIQSEANDLKRTSEALAEDLGLPAADIVRVIGGKADIAECFDVIEKMGKTYPIDETDMYLPRNDCPNGVKIMRSHESRGSSRRFKRVDRQDVRTEYYEYRDTAFSRISPFRPEWIRELRYVEDVDPANPDVVFNKGHFMHQLTFFVGPVNYYWEVKGQRYGREMSTGDSVYITPYWPHTFATRDKNELAYILAVTFGGNVRKALKEVYFLGDLTSNYVLDYRNPPAGFLQLLQHHLANQNFTRESFGEYLEQRQISLPLERIYSGTYLPTYDQVLVLASALEVEPGDLQLPPYKETDEVKFQIKSETSPRYYPSSQRKSYQIFHLARTSKMATCQGFEIIVATKELLDEDYFRSSLHNWVYNYGATPVNVHWEVDGQRHTARIEPNDSMYLLPFIRHGFTRVRGEATLCVMRVAGAVGLETQKEMSYFSDTSRAVRESTTWFD